MSGSNSRPTVASRPKPFTAAVGNSPRRLSPCRAQDSDHMCSITIVGSYVLVEELAIEGEQSPVEHKCLDQKEDADTNDEESAKLVSPSPGLANEDLDENQLRSCQTSPSGSTDSSESETQFKMSPDSQTNTPEVEVKSKQLHGEVEPTQHISVSNTDTCTSPVIAQPMSGQQELQEPGTEAAANGGTNPVPLDQEQAGDYLTTTVFPNTITKRIRRSKLTDVLVARNGESAKDFTFKMKVALEKSKVEVEFVVHASQGRNLAAEAYFNFPQDGKAKRNFQCEIKGLANRGLIIQAQVEISDPSKRCSLSTAKCELSLGPGNNSIDKTEVLDLPDVAPYNAINFSKSNFIELKMTASITVLCKPEEEFVFVRLPSPKPAKKQWSEADISTCTDSSS